MIVFEHLRFQSLRCLLAASVLFSCSSAPVPPDLGGLYNQSARHHNEHRNPVILIPGILGSRLIDPTTGQTVWGAFGGDSADPETPTGARTTALPMGLGVPLRDLGDEVVPDGVLGDLKVSLIGLPLTLKA